MKIWILLITLVLAGCVSDGVTIDNPDPYDDNQYRVTEPMGHNEACRTKEQKALPECTKKDLDDYQHIPSQEASNE